MVKLRMKLRMLIAGFLIVPVLPSLAQNPPEPTPPAPPVQPVQPPDKDNKGKQAPNQGDTNLNSQPIPAVVAGDINDTPPAGAAEPPIGILNARSYFLPSVSYYGQVDTNAFNSTQSGQYSVASINTILGGVALQKYRPNSELSLNYLGGRSFSNESDLFNSTTQELGIAQLWSRARWNGLVADEISYSSQASFFGNATPFDIAGLAQAGPITLHNTFLPGQSILTSFGPRLTNASVLGLNNRLSRRSTFSLVGNYDTLRFFNAGLIDSSAAGFQAGINYEVNRRDTIALAYRFNDLWFNGVPDRIIDNAGLVGFQRRFGERMVLQLGAGPEVGLIRNSNVPSDTHASWTARALIRYQFERSTLNASYDHYLTGGSGVFLGAETHLFSVGGSRQLSRVWTLRLTANYGHNTNLIPIVTSTTAAPSGASFDTAYGGFEMTRRVGRESHLFFGYTLRYQTSSTPFCTTGQSVTCGSTLLGNQVNFGFSWRPNPIPIG
jgi:hypothetical protein